MDALPASGRALAGLLALVAACGVFDGLTSGALYGEAGVLAPRYTQAIATGNSAAGALGGRAGGGSAVWLRTSTRSAEACCWVNEA